MTDQAPQILWIVDHLPDGRRTGREARQLEMIAALSEAGGESTVWAEHGGDTGPSSLQLDSAGARWVAAAPDSRWAPGHGVSLSDRFEALLAGAWDCVIVAGPRHTALVASLLRKISPGTPLITDLATVRFPTAHIRETGAAAKEKTAGLLMAAFSNADGVITASQPDASVLEDVTPGRPTFAFQALGSDHGPRIDPAGDGHLLFVGDLLHHPNLQAVEWWMEELASLVHARVGSPIPLRVAGRGSDAYHRLWDRPDKVTLAGWQADLALEHAAARLLVVPLPYATGTGGRIASALALGLPVVASAAAAAVLAPDLAALVLAGDDANQLADYIGRMMTDHDAWLEQCRLIKKVDLSTLRRQQAAALSEWIAAVTTTEGLPDAGRRSSRRSGNRRGRRQPSQAS